MVHAKKPLRLVNGTWRGPEMPKDIYPARPQVLTTTNEKDI